jgi:hypothetical protein
MRSCGRAGVLSFITPSSSAESTGRHAGASTILGVGLHDGKRHEAKSAATPLT